MTGLQASKLTDSLDGEHPVVCRMLYTEATMLVIQGWLYEAVGKLRAAEAGQKARLIAGDSTYMHLFDTQVRIVEALYAKFERQSAQQASRLRTKLWPRARRSRCLSPNPAGKDYCLWPWH